MNEAAIELPASPSPVKFTEKNRRNFWRKVNKDGPLPDQENPHYTGLDQCWIWTASIGGRLHRSGRGYGQIKIKDKLHLAHRISWLMHFGEIPDGLCVLHYCDNSTCVNPSHLHLGTLGENNTERETRQRGNQPVGDRSGVRLHPERVARGERQGSAKLTAESVKQIRREYKTGAFSQATLAKMHGVNQTLIGKIVNRRLWKHVP